MFEPCVDAVSAPLLFLLLRSPHSGAQCARPRADVQRECGSTCGDHSDEKASNHPDALKRPAAARRLGCAWKLASNDRHRSDTARWFAQARAGTSVRRPTRAAAPPAVPPFPETRRSCPVKRIVHRRFTIPSLRISRTRFYYRITRRALSLLLTHRPQMLWIVPKYAG